VSTDELGGLYLGASIGGLGPDVTIVSCMQSHVTLPVVMLWVM
jgi:hypothetical protein